MDNEIQSNNSPIQPAPLTPVNPPANWSKVLFVILLGLIVVGSIFVGIQIGKNQFKQQDRLPEKLGQTESENLIKLQNELDSCKSAEKYRLQEIIQKVNEDMGLEKYSNDSLHLSFSYPKSWGVISASENKSDITLRFPNFENTAVIFLFASNPNTNPPGRGAFWGDAGHLITGESLIENFCQNKIDFVPSKNDCSVFKNKNNVLISKVRGSSDCWENEGGCSEKAPQANYYYLYNSYSEYKGVVLSFERLMGYNITALEDKFNQIVESIEFTK